MDLGKQDSEAGSHISSFFAAPSFWCLGSTSGPVPAWVLVPISLLWGTFQHCSPQYSLLKWRGRQDPQRPLDSVPLEELSQEPVDGSSSRRMDWWTDCSTSHQAPFFPCNHVKLSHWMTLTHWFGVTQIVYIDRNHIPRASPAQKNLNSFPWNKSLHLPWFPILSPFPNFPQTKSLLVPHSPQGLDFLPLNPSVLMIEVLISADDSLECLPYIKIFQVLVI